MPLSLHALQVLNPPMDLSVFEQVSSSFYALFRPRNVSAGCGERSVCLANAACWRGLLGGDIMGYATETEALTRAAREPNTVDAIVAWDIGRGVLILYTHGIWI